MGHYIIVDIEWIEKGTFVNPTQISAVKVNSDWKGLSHYCKATEASVAGYENLEYIRPLGLLGQERAGSQDLLQCNEHRRRRFN